MFWLDTTILRLQNRKCLSDWVVTDSRYKHEVLVDGEPVLFEILDTCPKVQNLFAYNLTRVQNKFSFLPFPVNSKQKLCPKLYLTQVFERHFISKRQQTTPRNKILSLDLHVEPSKKSILLPNKFYNSLHIRTFGQNLKKFSQ